MSVIGTWILNETLNTNYTPEYPNGFGATVKATIKGSKTVTEGGEDFLLTWDLSVTFITSNALLPLGMQLTGDILANGEALISYNDDVVEIYKNGAYKSPFDILPKEITITEADNETFKYWLPLNAERVVIDKPLAEITYNGETIAQLNAGETATLSCEGKKMASDVVVKVGEVQSGSGIIEVDELPAVGEEGAFYKINTQFSDVILGGSSVVEMLPPMGAKGGFYTIPTKTTENIMVSDGSSTMYFYYIQDENDVFLYGDFGTGTDDWMLCGAMMGATFGGCISDISEATDTSLYYAVFSAPNGYFKYVNDKWINYLNVYEGIGSVVVNTFVIREYTKLPSADATANVNGYIAHYSGTNYRYKYFFNSLTFGADGNIKIMETGMGMTMNGNYSESTSEPSEVIVHTNDNKNTWYIGEGDTLVCGDEHLVLCFGSTPQEATKEFLSCLAKNSV